MSNFIVSTMNGQKASAVTQFQYKMIVNTTDINGNPVQIYANQQTATPNQLSLQITNIQNQITTLQNQLTLLQGVQGEMTTQIQAAAVVATPAQPAPVVEG